METATYFSPADLKLVKYSHRPTVFARCAKDVTLFFDAEHKDHMVNLTSYYSCQNTYMDLAQAWCSRLQSMQ